MPGVIQSFFFFFFSLICANAFYFHALSLFITFFFIICIMHSAFNLFVFPNYMFTSLLFFFLLYFLWKGFELSGEIALKNNHYCQRVSSRQKKCTKRQRKQKESLNRVTHNTGPHFHLWTLLTTLPLRILLAIYEPACRRRRPTSLS